MSSAYTLLDEEVALIRGMLTHRPDLSQQAILAHFSRPGRDINHRVISQIRDGWLFPHIPPARGDEVDRFLLDTRAFSRLAPAFLAGDGVASRRLFLDWWPVGQGLFASGVIAGGRGAPLNWVYDCGTTSSDGLLVTALDDFERQQRAIRASAIRLCVLSHFDNDHISGIVRLVGRMRVQTLLLPYIPLWRRLLIAIDEGVGASDDLFGFFLNPAAWLAARGEGQIDEVIFVPGGGPDDLPPAAPEGEDGGDPDDRELDLKPEYGEAPEDAAGDIAAAPTQTSLQVRFLKPAGRILAPLLWEFVPYNDATMAPKASRLFLQIARPLITKLRDEPNKRVEALAELKAVYDSYFGKTSTRRNLISLFLYSGPVGARMRLWHGPLAELPVESEDFAQMHTGDGVLKDIVRYDAFARFYRSGRRLARAKVFQVMHHGARTSWHAGLAAKVAPRVSIFPSDPARRWRHPHAEVLRDFYPFGPRRVDTVNGFALRAWLVF